MNIRSTVQSLRRIAHTHGLSAAIYDATVRAVNKVLYYRRLECVVIEDVNPAFSILPESFAFARVETADLRRIATNPAYELTADFIEEAATKGDVCYGILDGETLASYGWYSHSPTLLDNERLSFRFDPSYVYMYKGLTLDAWRGKRLHAIGMTRALAAYRAEGFRGLISYVESNNFDSLRSCERMGYRRCGAIWIIGIGSRYLIKRSASCSGYGLDVAVSVSPYRSVKKSFAGAP